VWGYHGWPEHPESGERLIVAVLETKGACLLPLIVEKDSMKKGGSRRKIIEPRKRAGEKTLDLTVLWAERQWGQKREISSWEEKGGEMAEKTTRRRGKRRGRGNIKCAWMQNCSTKIRKNAS